MSFEYSKPRQRGESSAKSVIILNLSVGPAIQTMAGNDQYICQVWYNYESFVSQSAESVSPSVRQVPVVQSVPEVLDLVLQLPDQLVLRVVLHVHHGLVVDGLGRVGVLQGAESLLEVGVRGRDVGDHHGASVTSQ